MIIEDMLLDEYHFFIISLLIAAEMPYANDLGPIETTTRHFILILYLSKWTYPVLINEVDESLGMRTPS